jgi:4-hydroxy-tetrahydrodipicolinate reductase
MGQVITPIIVLGAAGRMGQMVIACAGASEEPYQLIAAVDRADHPELGKELTEMLPGAPGGVKLSGELPKKVASGTVVIDFTHPESSMAMLPWAESNGASVIVATTGLSAEQRERVEAAAERIPVIFSPNMSVGVNVLFELVREATRLLGPNFDIEITEMHHRFKKDAPSGTAQRLAEVVNETRKDGLPDVRHGRVGFPGERTAREVGMHAIRGGDVVGDHTVMFAALGERLELTHRASSRETFARGALRAASWLYNKPAGLYTMKDVLGL